MPLLDLLQPLVRDNPAVVICLFIATCALVVALASRLGFFS